MQRNSFVKMTKLPNVKGRIYYISSPVRQENLYAVYETTERSFWTELAKCNQIEFVKSGAEGKCIEARELIIALPETFVDYPPDKLLKVFTEYFKENYGTECIAALHHNKRKTNYHIHLIFSERKLLEQPIEKVAPRNMFYDETGKHVRTKKEILDDVGQIREGCKVIPKGEVYERNIFEPKDRRFKNEKFLEEVKQSYTDLINLYVKDEKEKLKVFDRNGVYLPTKKIGKNNPEAEEIKTDNEVRIQWNQTVDQALICGVPEQKILWVKREQISKTAYRSICSSGKRPGLFPKIVLRAIETLRLMIEKIFKAEVQKPDLRSEMRTNAPETDVKKEMLDRVAKTEQVAQEAVQMLQKETVYDGVEIMEAYDQTENEPPKQSEKVSRYLRLEGIYKQLQKQNRTIHSKEEEIENLEQELANTKGVFRGKQRKEMQEKIEKGKTQLANMKQHLQGIATEHHYDSVKDFMRDYNDCKTEYDSYEKALKQWNLENNSVRKKLNQGMQTVKERDKNKQQIVSRPHDRSGR